MGVETRPRTGWRLGRALLGWALAIGISLGAGPALAQESKVPAGWRFTLPMGDPVAGENAFAKMQCYSCHTVPGKRFVDPSQRPGGIGPDLTRAYAALPREYLAESIVNSARIIAHGRARYTAPDGSTKMGDYGEAMTVRELRDIVEFIKGLR